MDLALQVLLGDLFSQLLVAVDAVQSLALLQSRLVHILLLSQSEREHVVEEALQ